jgi:hypothetical protein
VTALTLATEVQGNPAYAAHAAAHVRVWFLDEKTRMTPTMRFAQWNAASASGNNDRGVVDFRDLWPLFDAFRLLARRGVLTPQDEKRLKAWSRTLLVELVKRGGQPEEQTNTGVWHDLMFTTLAAYSDEIPALASSLARATLRIHRQVLPWGAQPGELVRAQPLHHALFGIQAMSALASMGRANGIDLWRYAGAHHRSIPMALRFVALNRTVFDDYAAGRDHFDDRIESALRMIPADAADAEVLRDLPRRPLANPAQLGAADGFPPLWPSFLARDGDAWR